MHSHLQAVVRSVCDVIGFCFTGPPLALRDRLATAVERARVLVKGAVYLGIHRALAVFRSHYAKINMQALQEGYFDAEDTVLDAIDAEVEQPSAVLASLFEGDVELPPLDL